MLEVNRDVTEINALIVGQATLVRELSAAERKHGSLIVVSLSVSPVKNAEGKIVGASKIARDITEQKRSQEQIATLAQEAEHRSKNRSRLRFCGLCGYTPRVIAETR